MRDKTWDDDKKQAFEVWKCHTNIGGDDKNWMIQIVTWLLAISSAIFGFAVTQHDIGLSQHVLLPILGIGVSLLGALVAILYGGYAAAHWKIADSIANEYGLEEQRSKNWPYKDEVGSIWSAIWSVNRLARWFAKPCNGKVAPVFWVYFFMSLGFALAHLFVLVCK